MATIGKLSEIDVRELWKHEQYDFSRWLSRPENIEYLNEILGLTLTEVNREVYVGPYRCDIVAKDETSGITVIIENQLEGTNHEHLGKIITYASGLGAKVMVWIVKEAKEEHRNSLVFAFVGDAIFTLFVRTHLAEISTAKAGVLHTNATRFVRASYQKMLLENLEEVLTQEEIAICLTARNQKTNNVAKNSNLEEYKKSTSFEALLGYLYLTNQNERLFEILNLCKNQMEKDL